MGTTANDRPSARSRAAPVTPPVRERRADSRRVLAFALIASVLLHALVFLAVRFETVVYIVGGRFTPAVPGQPAMRVVEMVVVAQDESDQAEVVVEEPAEPDVPTETTEAEPEPPELPVQLPPIPTVDRVVPLTERAADDRSIMDRLSGDPDARVFRAPVARMALPVEGLDAARERIVAGIGAYNDSMVVAAAAAARLTDWTVTDDDGNRWGISPGALHLGPITLPLPIGFSAPADVRAEMNRWVGEWSAIQMQRSRADVRETIKERAAAIRARKAAQDTTKSGG